MHTDSITPAPLEGLRVLDLGTVYAAPISAMLLGDLGADVIKVEHPTGDPARTHGYVVNGHGLWWKVIARNKSAITLDLGRDDGADLLLRLVAKSDVLIENFRPGVLERWGLSPAVLHEINPQLVILRLSGFGQQGPYAQRRAFGTLIEAMSGFAHMTGQADGPPTLPPFGLADGVAGYAGACAVLAAIVARHDGVPGQIIDLALLDPLLSILGPAPSAFQQLGIKPGRHGNASPNNAPRNTYRTRDGNWVAVSSSTTPVARRVMAIIGHPEIAEAEWFDSASERARRRGYLDGLVGGWIADNDMDTVTTIFTDGGAAVAPINDVEGLMADPHVRWRQSITTVDDDDLGPLAMQNTVFRFSNSSAGIRHPGRRLGQDNDRIYRGLLGLDEKELSRLRHDAVI